MSAVIKYEDDPEEHNHDEEREFLNLTKGETNTNFTKPEYSYKEEKWSNIKDTVLYLISIAMCVGIFYIYVLVIIVNETHWNEMSNYAPKSKHWVMWRSMRA